MALSVVAAIEASELRFIQFFFFGEEVFQIQKIARVHLQSKRPAGKIELERPFEMKPFLIRRLGLNITFSLWASRENMRPRDAETQFFQNSHTRQVNVFDQRNELFSKELSKPDSHFHSWTLKPFCCRRSLQQHVR